LASSSSIGLEQKVSGIKPPGITVEDGVLRESFKLGRFGLKRHPKGFSPAPGYAHAFEFFDYGFWAMLQNQCEIL